MGLLTDIFDFIDDLTVGGSYYVDNSLEWSDKAWRRINRKERGEARLIQIGDKLYHQLHVTMEDDMDACVTEKTDRGCDIERIRLKKIQKEQLAKYGYVVLKKYS